MSDQEDDSWSPKIKPRWRFSAHEIELLESVYCQQPNPSSSAVEPLAERLKCPRKSITTWFQNRRAKQKRRLSASSSLKRLQQQQQDDEKTDQAWLEEASAWPVVDCTDLCQEYNNNSTMTTDTAQQQQGLWQNTLQDLFDPAAEESENMTDGAFAAVDPLDLVFPTFRVDQEDFPLLSSTSDNDQWMTFFANNSNNKVKLFSFFCGFELVCIMINCWKWKGEEEKERRPDNKPEHEREISANEEMVSYRRI